MRGLTPLSEGSRFERSDIRPRLVNSFLAELSTFGQLRLLSVSLIVFVGINIFPGRHVLAKWEKYKEKTLDILMHIGSVSSQYRPPDRKD